MGEYERFKRKVEKEIKKMKENLDGVNEGIEELKDEML
jgi:chromosome segregation ATPase